MGYESMIVVRFTMIPECDVDVACIDWEGLNLFKLHGGFSIDCSD